MINSLYIREWSLITGRGGYKTGGRQVSTKRGGGGGGLQVTVVNFSFSGATEKDDSLCKEAFYKAGWWLGRHVLAIAPKVDKVRT